MEVTRATFNQVNEWQLEFLFGETGLQTLIEKKETVDKDSRRTYFDLFAKSLLGKGLNYNYTLKIDGETHNLGSLSIQARRLCFMEDTKDNKQPMKLKGKTIRVPIEKLWEALRENMYKPMDEALTMAMRSSAELLKKEGGAYEFNPEKRRKKQETKE